MLPVAQEPALAHPADSHVPVKQHASPYLPECMKTRFLMLACAIFTCVSQFAPLKEVVGIGDSRWQAQLTAVNMTAWMGPPFPNLTLGLSILLIAATLCWGHGFRYARWLRWLIAFITLYLMAFGLLTGLQFGVWIPGGPPVVGGVLLGNPVTGLAFVLNIVYGARRSLIPYRGDIRS